LPVKTLRDIPAPHGWNACIGDYDALFEQVAEREALAA
jgi:hypothetical protein